MSEVRKKGSTVSKRVVGHDDVKESKTGAPKGKYFYAVGRRKTSIAQVRLYSDIKYVGESFVVNDKKIEDFFPEGNIVQDIFKPLELTGLLKKIGISALVRGGGVRGQAEAIRLAVSRALTLYDEKLRQVLKSARLLKRDARVVERKKPGLKKARRAPQWAKR